MRPIERRTKNVPLNVATHLPITKGERIHFYQNSIPPCKGILRCVARLLYHIFGYLSITIANIIQHKKTAQREVEPPFLIKANRAR